MAHHNVKLTAAAPVGYVNPDRVNRYSLTIRTEGEASGPWGGDTNPDCEAEGKALAYALRATLPYATIQAMLRSLADGDPDLSYIEEVTA